jgi:hypothetical protein
MHTLLKPSVAVFSIFLGLAALDTTLTPHQTTSSATEPVIHKTTPKIQAAILLDVSNSMDGLIEQAKAQLWNMVTVMGKAKCNEEVPQIEIALYEYGRDNNSIKDGYVKQVSAFTSDLDKLSQDLFKLTTNGGQEYCGQVIYTSLNDLKWDASSASYKVIFISGNEDFLQGGITYTKACEEARKKGVIVNTIYCGDKMQGVREHWNLGGECGSGSFTNIDPNAALDDIVTPYDSTLYVLNYKLNGTYIGYGSAGASNVARQAEMDQSNYQLNKAAMAKRAAVKGNKYLYNNSSWDLLDAVAADSSFVAKVDLKTLPDSLKNKSRAELQQIVKAKNNERSLIQKQLGEVSIKRDAYIAAERARAAGNTNTATLETQVEKIIKEQAKRFNMIIQ